MSTHTHQTSCRPNGTKRATSKPPSKYAHHGVLHTTDDDDRRQKASLVWPLTMCVGGPVHRGNAVHLPL